MAIKKTRYLLVIAALVASVSVGYAATLFFGYESTAVAQNSIVYIPTGADFPLQVEILRETGAVKNINRYKRFAKMLGLDKKALPGRYELKKGMSYGTLVNMLGRGMQSPVNLTFNNIRTLDRLAGVASKYIEADSLSILAALESDSMAAKYGFDRANFIGMFIPNTYQFYWNTTPQQFIARMNKEYQKFWNDERTKKQQASGLSKTEIVTLASIVGEETHMSDEMPRVAGVYLNRIKIGMLLQADPTVKFAVGDFALRRILYSHLAIDSPYNTYKYTGLPPGPISIPSIAAIDAVLDAEEDDYLFFCAKEDFSGRHNFAKNLDDHNKNARAYARALNAKGIK